MADRFKFRKWTQDCKQYLCWEHLEKCADLGQVFREHDTCSIIEQCTGLKDKNGELIYEGDICTDITDDIFIVVWDKEDASFRLQEDDNVLHEFDNDVSIIGNIHENPELLS